jgi:hypothetical protein
MSPEREVMYKAAPAAGDRIGSYVVTEDDVLLFEMRQVVRRIQHSATIEYDERQATLLLFGIIPSCVIGAITACLMAMHCSHNLLTQLVFTAFYTAAFYSLVVDRGLWYIGWRPGPYNRLYSKLKGMDADGLLQLGKMVREESETGEIRDDVVTVERAAKADRRP